MGSFIPFNLLCLQQEKSSTETKRLVVGTARFKQVESQPKLEANIYLILLREMNEGYIGKQLKGGK